MGSNARNKTVLISGASSGIGFATTLRLAQNGWIVFAGVRKKSDYDRLKESHSNIYPVYLDVTKADQISKAIDIIKNMVKEAGLDALVNNSGAAHNGPIEFMPIEVVKEEFDVNVFGVYRLTQAALPLLRIGKPGRIINIGSLLGKATTAFSSSYCATKHALESLTVAMRLELSPMGRNFKVLSKSIIRLGIQVSLIGPGPVQSNFGTSALDVMDDFNNENKENSIYREYYAKKMMNTQDMFVRSLIK